MSSKLRALGLLCIPLVLVGCGHNKKKNKGTSGTDSTTDNGSTTSGTGGMSSTSAGTGGTSTGGTGVGGTAGQGGGGGGEAPMPLEPGGRAINLTPERFFPEGVAVSKEGNFYVGSMDTGAIYTATANDEEASPFIEPDDDNQLVSVIGLYVDDATQTLYACSSDAGNSQNAGNAPVAIVAFDLSDDGAFVARYEWPEYSGEPGFDTTGYDPNGFCNDMTMDADGNLYATDSWYPRIVMLPAGGDELEEWAIDEAGTVFPADSPWHLNGIDIDQSNDIMYVVENHPGALYAIPLDDPTDITEIALTRTDDVDTTDTNILSPDGLKVAAPNLLITAEGANNGGDVAVIRIDGDEGEIAEVISGFDQVATFALREASAWIVENQADHFWGPDDNGPDANPPFRLVEVPLAVGAGADIIETTTENFFSEGVTVDADDNFYMGSMNLGTIERAAIGDSATSVFIEPDDDNGLVSVLGMYADDANDMLYACSSDAGNSTRAGEAPVAIVAFELSTGDFVARYEWPEYSGTPEFDTTDYDANGFCNDITMDADGNLYATDSWYPRILVLPAGGDALEEWVVDGVEGDGGVFPDADPWHLNGIDYDAGAGANGTIYAVENHPGALYAIPVMGNGNAGTPVEITTQRPLYMPDGLKVIGDGVLAVAEGQTSGMAIVELGNNDTGYVRRISTGLDGIATFAMVGGNAWLVENQGDHFWGGDGMETKPFRLVETPLNQ